MNLFNVLDPSVVADGTNATVVVTADSRLVDLPLAKVCATQAYWLRGLAYFVMIVWCCLGFVIFVTSKQSLSGLRAIVSKRAPPPPLRPTRRDRLAGQCVLFGVFNLVCFVIMAFFSTVRIFSAPRERSYGGWGDACASNNQTALRELGLA